ncbi:molybdopterin-dependent oxidoreductase [Pseudomonas fluorescens]|uniref:Putative exported oxidoreductase subunit n=1 Tax=Pseudomonas fluorescens (strain Pf0-1) TaxID=205922 RepID=Q3KAP1_PSEPF|nr:molybdopterin cofactor-binding domain-containing protein [Pseudomonas fluorescens]ABA75163.1 putative exported oxidoreductase subunit [Pseudomonas fluorescens Pf0-1]MBY9024618.1 molybdopterin-dependent oxidoreductase [Pseudomonas fluorescens]MBY9030867.1 molybdopterin-dependent oxidoreductase [Pseudomonas fluorescens]MBY9036870.1 molybdopterin-dependent oxidoreductase [Pseudomonas fluorescens]MBY9042976.1 molybdopterin-dependent oxidoreductase [Pseudomonas fluorescens]
MSLIDGTLQEPSRRVFLKQAVTVASGLAIALYLPSGAAATEPKTSTTEFEPNAWVRVLPDGTVKLVVHKHDSGTGTQTALAACVAEELDVNPMTVQVITPENPFFETYIHPVWKVFSTGGSTSVSLEYDRLRMAGATARALLISAAAQQWKVSPDSCSTEEGRVVHASSKRSLGYGEVAGAAAHLSAPANVTLKDPAQFKYIGKLRHKRDAAAKVCGRFNYSIDVQLPGMLVAVIQRAPVVGAKVVAVDSAAALQVPGVRKVIAVPGRPDVLGGNLEGVAVLAETFWAAQQGRQLLEIKWSDSPLAGFDSADLAKAQIAAISDPATQTVKAMAQGDVAGQWPGAAKLLEADYTMPYKVQNPLEPICITAQVKDKAITYWGGVQVPSSALEAAQTVCGIAKDKVTIHELVSGGSFGAREAKYWLFEVAYLAQKTGVPVKLLNSREDEMHALFYHPATLHRVKGALDAQGKLTALQLHAVSPASPEQWEPGYFERPDHMDYSTTEAITAWDFAYRPPHLELNWVKHESNVPSGWYRSVSFIPNVFAVESFMDELAHAAGKDPLAFRLASMQERPWHVAVLKQAAERAGWGQKLPPDTALGIATNQGYTSFIAVVARVAKVDGKARVEKLTCVVDCGLAVSPGGVEEQIYGGLMWGLGHALFDRLDIQQGRVVQSNFHDYRVTRMSDMPPVDILVLNGQPDKPGGVGELGSPSVVPAIANALFSLTGVRQRSTPLNLG